MPAQDHLPDDHGDKPALAGPGGSATGSAKETRDSGTPSGGAVDDADDLDAEDRDLGSGEQTDGPTDSQPSRLPASRLPGGKRQPKRGVRPRRPLPYA